MSLSLAVPRNSALEPGSSSLCGSPLAHRCYGSAAIARYTHHTRFGGVRLLVSEGLFCPAASTTSRLMLAILKRLPVHEATVMDLGTGTGALAVIAALLGATEVVATDIDGRAITAARRNVRKSGVANKVRVVTADLYDDVYETVFDIILANLPLRPSRHQGHMSRLDATLLLDRQYRLFARMLGQGRKLLRPAGAIVYPVTPFARKRWLHAIAAREGWSVSTWRPKLEYRASYELWILRSIA